VGPRGTSCQNDCQELLYELSCRSDLAGRFPYHVAIAAANRRGLKVLPLEVHTFGRCSAYLWASGRSFSAWIPHIIHVCSPMFLPSMSKATGNINRATMLRGDKAVIGPDGYTTRSTHVPPRGLVAKILRAIVRLLHATNHWLSLDC
jgi:methionine synthase II (cobalamin-independent)